MGRRGRDSRGCARHCLRGGGRTGRRAEVGGARELRRRRPRAEGHGVEAVRGGEGLGLGQREAVREGEAHGVSVHVPVEDEFLRGERRQAIERGAEALLRHGAVRGPRDRRVADLGGRDDEFGLERAGRHRLGGGAEGGEAFAERRILEGDVADHGPAAFGTVEQADAVEREIEREGGCH
jgi:hypothetical protein